jgi:phosphatidyl-myo-inositol dimannoside synthase
VAETPAAPQIAGQLAKQSVLLCSSGLGTQGGGVGVVAQLLHEALAQRYQVTHLEYRPNLGLRARLAFAAALAAEQWRGHALQVFSHIDLMRSLPWTPRPPSCKKNARDVLFVHGFEVWRPLNAARSAALAGARLLINSQSSADRMRQFHPDRRACVLHLGAQFGAPPTLAQTLAAKAAQPTVVIVGRMSHGESYKGHDQLIDAWPAVVRAVPTAVLICLGGGDDVARLSQKAAALSANIVFKQGVSDAERDRLVRSAHLCALPSTGEGFGLAAIEAASDGLPVLGVAGTVMAEIFPPTQSGHAGAILAHEQSSAALAACIIQQLQNPDAALELGQLGQRYVREHYSAAAFYARFWASFPWFPR